MTRKRQAEMASTNDAEETSRYAKTRDGGRDATQSKFKIIRDTTLGKPTSGRQPHSHGVGAAAAREPLGDEEAAADGRAPPAAGPS